MKQNLKQTARRRTKPTSPWIIYCVVGGLILLAIAGMLYAYRYMSLDREFHHNIKTFGEETYKEIFALEDTKKKAEPILELAEEAFSFVGTETEASQRFGLLSRYSCTEPKATAEEHTLDYIVSKIEEDKGYLWIAYSKKALDPGGEAISASGSKSYRVLARWTVEKSSEQTWTVTEILEGP